MRTVLGNLIPSGELKLFKGRGCEKCNHTGYLGRVGIFETLIVSPAIARLIMERATAETIEKQSVSEGMITLKQDGYLKVLQGTTTLEEIFRVAQE